ncbi:hypothetical protein NG54_12225 [Heyndrickxia ginsengihumi]|uniref:Uncharacterized protein n=1 Tax=Heyndrickxia ginsengihumi TaxID=363870 RepID=A0A0A6VEJ5_9BACI|nr:hypothetical protein NG54_12225 [Heyndrickxia ginsengihumi]
MEKYDHIDKENIPYTDFSNVETEKIFSFLKICRKGLMDLQEELIRLYKENLVRGKKAIDLIAPLIMNLNHFIKIYQGNIQAPILHMMTRQ